MGGWGGGAKQTLKARSSFGLSLYLHPVFVYARSGGSDEYALLDYAIITIISCAGSFQLQITSNKLP